MFQRIHDTHRTSPAFMLRSEASAVGVNHGEVAAGVVMRVGKGWICGRSSAAHKILHCIFSHRLWMEVTHGTGCREVGCATGRDRL